ncbi:Por secretion system C-terminal sorting domain-containing protein [Psychroflexus salarius]|uniref:Por secretion system C-terminal sorting domain-containing protein n=1 Tax=Psychroflexus salarius TaxID=1155689 RepID=A0A1M4XGK9_9FLAO|nr:T9SS type A sorting domain-containing protein [Psychroflexus salarius]SHE92684.1 Por secretion system C-terminal sorting domain-containing protein [Psychroflexus salarius]
MKTIIKLLIICLLGQSLTSLAQTTAIPDENFEQALIDLNIDSDGMINGQVLTADIETIVELDFSILYDSFSSSTITDFTGIEAFSALEILNLSNLTVILSEEQAGVFNSNLNLREFIADTQSADVGPYISIAYLDFSNLNHLEYISLETSFQLNSINLNNPNSSYENLTIDLDHEYWDPPNTYSVCINVSDAQAASSNQFPYNTWTIITPAPDVNGYVFRDYNFSSTCNLSTTAFERLSALSVYPNPVQDQLWLKNPTNLDINKAEIYTISGQMIKKVEVVDRFIDVELLDTGVYFVKLYSAQTSKTFKVLKQ